MSDSVEEHGGSTMMEETEENSETIISDHNTELGGMMARVTMMSDIKDIDKLLRVPAPGTRAATEFMARYGTGENNLRNLRNIQYTLGNTIDTFEELQFKNNKLATQTIKAAQETVDLNNSILKLKEEIVRRELNKQASEKKLSELAEVPARLVKSKSFWAIRDKAKELEPQHATEKLKKTKSSWSIRDKAKGTEFLDVPTRLKKTKSLWSLKGKQAAEKELLELSEVQTKLTKSKSFWNLKGRLQGKGTTKKKD